MFLGDPSVGFMGLNSYVLSIQQVSITIGAAATTNTATITAVGSNAFLVYQGQSNTNSASTSDFPKVWSNAVLTNSTTVTATRNTSDASITSTINVLIIDPASSLVQSVQAGTISLTAATSNTATITSVTTSRSAVFYLGHTQTSSTLGLIGVTLTNGTTVTANAGASMTGSVSYVVVQFQASAIQSIQQFSSAFTSSNAADTQTITSVTTSNSMLAYGGETFTGTYQQWYWLTLTNATTVTLTRNATSTTTRSPYYTVIEFKTGVVKSAQRGSISLSTASSATATVTSVVTAKSACSHLGLQTAANSGSPSGGDLPKAVFSKLTLTNATTVTTSTGANQIEDVGYELVEFN